MKFSRLFAPTLKEAPKEATLASHIYLTRGAFIAQVNAGIYDFLPLGKRVLEKVRRIIQDELDNAGCQEVQLGFVTPAEMWQESGRYEKYGKELLRFRDRKNGEFVLGPTHEEMMVDLVRGRISSYKDLPLNLYQINLKFRDEARPRFGLMRGREFLMKDGYSFHSSIDDMKREFHLMEETYSRIFNRLGLDHRIVDADSGAIGGSGSKEFMVLAESGEDTIVLCSHCRYAANIEAAKRTSQPFSLQTLPYEEVHTPQVKSIDELAHFFNYPSTYFVKTVAKKALFDDNKTEIILFCIRGSDELEETKAKNSVNANELIDVSEEELLQNGLIAGFMGPQTTSVKVIMDHEIRHETSMFTGANKTDYHCQGVNIATLTHVIPFDLIAVKENDSCPECQHPLMYSKGIEVGHIFQLGERYSAPLKAQFLDNNGKTQNFVMGTYGIGVSRLLAAIIEQHHDEKGCQWTKESTPYHIHIIVSNSKDETQSQVAQELYENLQHEGYDVLLDDRNERFGAKMNDFELIGIPLGIIIGKNIANQEIEIIQRQTLEKNSCHIHQVYEEIARRFKGI